MERRFDHELMADVARQMMSGTLVLVDGKKFPVTRTGSLRLRTVRLVLGEREYHVIEQNPEKPSRWGKLAGEGKRVVQVRDVGLGKYVAAVVDGKVFEYGR